MIRMVLVVLVLTGCSIGQSVPTFPACPAPIPVPAPTVRKPNAKQIAQLEIRVELAREAERARGDACAEAVMERDQWIRRK